MPASRYRKKPVEIDAMQFTGGNTDEVSKFLYAGLASPVPDYPGRPFAVGGPSGEYLVIETLEGDMRADVGDWIIKGIKGEFYPCKPDIFEATYEAV